MEAVTGEVTVYDTVIRELQQAEKESREVLDHVALIRKAAESGYRESLRNLLRVLIEEIDVRANEAQYEVRVRLYPIPVVRTILETIPNAREAVPPGIEPGSPA